MMLNILLILLQNMFNQYKYKALTNENFINKNKSIFNNSNLNKETDYYFDKKLNYI